MGNLMANTERKEILSSFFAVVLSLTFSIVGFFRNDWVTLKYEEDEEIGNMTTTVVGLWDGGLTDLNCPGTPIDICLPTRGFLFANLTTMLPCFISISTSLVVYLSKGNLLVCANSARVSAVLLVVSACNLVIGLSIFTSFHSGTTKPSSGYQSSFYLSWIALFMSLTGTLTSCLFTSKIKQQAVKCEKIMDKTAQSIFENLTVSKFDENKV